MREHGVVTEAHSGEATVRITGGEACAKCGCCVSLGSGEMLLEGVLNPRSAVEGDAVEIEVPERSRLLANALIFGVPVAALALGYLAGYLLASVLGTSPDLTGALVALGAVGLTFAWLRAKGSDLLSGDRDRPRVSAILPRSDEGAGTVQDSAGPHS